MAFAIARSGSSDSAAAIVAISAPTIEKMTTTMAEKIAPTPWGKKPPCTVRLLKSRLRPGHRPRAKSNPTARNTMIAPTLMPANQNSNSPNEDTEKRFVAVIITISTSDSTHRGTPGSQNVITFAPATASNPTTITQKYQYSQATENPAQPPMALRA